MFKVSKIKKKDTRQRRNTKTRINSRRRIGRDLQKCYDEQVPRKNHNEGKNMKKIEIK